MEAELTTLRQEHETVRGQYMRIMTDFDNFRKRQQRDAEDLKLQLTCSTLGEILPVVDNLSARQQLNPESEEAQALHRSYQGKQLVDVLKQLSVSPMRVEGEPFDPTCMSRAAGTQRRPLRRRGDGRAAAGLSP